MVLSAYIVGDLLHDANLWNGPIYWCQIIILCVRTCLWFVIFIFGNIKKYFFSNIYKLLFRLPAKFWKILTNLVCLYALFGLKIEIKTGKRWNQAVFCNQSMSYDSILFFLQLLKLNLQLSLIKTMTDEHLSRKSKVTYKNMMQR